MPKKIFLQGGGALIILIWQGNILVNINYVKSILCLRVTDCGHFYNLDDGGGGEK